jgi:hypothetical protein
MWAMDIDFSNAVYRAAHAMKKAHATLRAGANDGDTAALVRYLRSDVPIGPGEREMLADLIAGELGKLAQRPPEPQKQRAWQEVLDAVLERKKQYKAAGIKKLMNEIVDEVAKKFGVDPHKLAARRRKSR